MLREDQFEIFEMQHDTYECHEASFKLPRSRAPCRSRKQMAVTANCIHQDYLGLNNTYPP